MQEADLEEFRRVCEEYWQEVMPHSDATRTAERRDSYFPDCFQRGPDIRQPYWAVVDGERVGFVAFTLDRDKQTASIDDFYVFADLRRRGYGTAMVEAIRARMSTLGVELIELNVRRDNLQALEFWEAQGFRVASHRLRQYRDPETGEWVVGALSSDFVGEGAAERWM